MHINIELLVSMDSIVFERWYWNNFVAKKGIGNKFASLHANIPNDSNMKWWNWEASLNIYHHFSFECACICAVPISSITEWNILRTASLLHTHTHTRKFRRVRLSFVCFCFGVLIIVLFLCFFVSGNSITDKNARKWTNKRK